MPCQSHQTELAIAEPSPDLLIHAAFRTMQEFCQDKKRIDYHSDTAITLEQCKEVMAASVWPTFYLVVLEKVVKLNLP